MRRAAAKRNMPPATKQSAEGMAPAMPAVPQRSRTRTNGSISKCGSGQPHGAHLVVARRARIDDAARDVEMRLGVAVIEQPAVGIEDTATAAALSSQDQRARATMERR